MINEVYTLDQSRISFEPIMVMTEVEMDEVESKLRIHLVIYNKKVA